MKPWVLGLVLVTLLGASFGLGWLFARPAWQDVEDSAQQIEVWGAVENRVVADRTEVSGSVKPPVQLVVTLDSTVQPAVVTRSGPVIGRTLNPGDLIAEVSGHPFIAVSGPLALYRNLRAGDRGEDVKTLQRALTRIGFPVRDTGTVGPVTLRMVQALFRAQGYSLPTETVPAEPPLDNDDKPAKSVTRAVIPFRQFVPVQAGVVLSRAELGARLGGDTPVITLAVSQKWIEAVIPVDAAGAFDRGQNVEIMSEGKVVPGKVAHISEFRAEGNGQLPGYPMKVVIDGKAAAELGSGASVLVVTLGSTVGASPAVPLTAIRSDAQGDYVSIRSGAAPSRVSVTILRTAHGWAAITGVPVGTQVLLS